MKAADLSERDRPDPFEPANPNAHAGFAVAIAQYCFFAQMDVQDDLGPQFLGIDAGRLDDQPAPGRSFAAAAGFSLHKIVDESSGEVIGWRLGSVVDGFVGLLRLGGGTLLVAKLP